MDRSFGLVEGKSLARPSKRFSPDHPFIEDLKRNAFVASMALT
jgi:hypothetical protein